jgi:hypothetical protein
VPTSAEKMTEGISDKYWADREWKIAGKKRRNQKLLRLRD